MRRAWIWLKPTRGWMAAERGRPLAALLGLALFLACALGLRSEAAALQHYDLEREAGDNFVSAYLEVDNVLMGGTGKSHELAQAMEYANARLKHDEFSEMWSHILEMECLPTALDMRGKIKDGVEYDWIQRYNAVCYKKFIFFHWSEVNESIEKRYAQVRSPEFLEGGRIRH